jgi:glycosyltransferase involved in cell wall biosynthesis
MDISVVIPTFNRADVLDRNLRHLAAQTVDRSRFEVIVADDASTDDTDAVGSRWQDSDDLDVTYIKCEKGFAGAARNRGAEAARSERILFLGDDILAAPDLIERHLESAEQWGDRAVIIGNVAYRADGRTPFMRFLEDEGVHHAFPQMAAAGDAPLSGRFFYACNASLPRRAHEQIGGFDERITRAWEDSEYGLRLEWAGYELRYEAAATAEHVHPITLDRYVRFLRSGREDIAKVLELVRDAGEPIPVPPDRPLVDRMLTDPVVGAATSVVSKADRVPPDRVRRPFYRAVLRYERRRARRAVAPAHA